MTKPDYLSMPLMEFFETVYQQTDWPASHYGTKTGVMAGQAVRRYEALMGNTRMGDITPDTIARWQAIRGKALADIRRS